MKKMGKKGKIILFLLIFFLTTPLIIFYSLEGLGVFDTRSRANFDWEKCPYSGADLDRDSKVGMGDFEVWLKEYRAFKKDPNTNGRMGDLDKDGKIRINDFAVWTSLWRGFKACQDNVMRCSPWCYASERRVNFEESGTLHKCSDVPQIDIKTAPSKKEDCWMLGFSSVGVPSAEKAGLQYLRLELEEDSMCSFSNGRKEVCTYNALESYYSKSSGSIYASVEGYYEKGAPVKISYMDISGTEDKCSTADEVVKASVGKTFQLSITFGAGTPYRPYSPVYDSKVLKLVSESDAEYQSKQTSPGTITGTTIGGPVTKVYTFQALKPTYGTCTVIRLGLYHVHDETDKEDEKTVAVFVTEETVDPRFDVVDAKAYCDKIPGAKWLPAYSECELLGVTNPQQYAGQCVKLGGVYDDCASACRHTVGKDVVCIDVCVPLCDFGGSSPLQPLEPPIPITTEGKCSTADEEVKASVGKTFQVSITFGAGMPYRPYPPAYDNKVLKLVSQNDISGPEGQDGGPVTRVYTFQALKPTYNTCTLIGLGLYHVHDETDKEDEKTVAVFVTEGTGDKCSTADEEVKASVGKTFQVSITFGGGTPYRPYSPVYDNKVLKLISQNDVSRSEPMPGGPVTRVYTFQALKPTYNTCTLIGLGLSHFDNEADQRDEKTVAVFVTEETVDPRFDVVDAKAYCDKIPGAKWLPAYSECELLGVTNPQQYAGQCVKLGGVYDDCASACRHTVGKDVVCIDVCVPLCAFGGGGSSSL